MPATVLVPPRSFVKAQADLRNGAEILLDTLIESGIDTIFGYPGGAELPLYDALYSRPALRHVLVRHEHARATVSRSRTASTSSCHSS